MATSKTASEKREEQRVYDEAVELFNGLCALCYKPMEARHHIRYGSCGRKTYRGNIIPLCTICHNKVHSSKKKWQPILIEIIDRKLEENE